MLVAMTYNTYLFGAILVGSFAGHWMYEPVMVVGLPGAGAGGGAVAG